MCGIVAGRYDDSNGSADSPDGFRCDHGTGLVDVLLAGLHRLEHRGYDSAGLAVLSPGAPTVERRRAVGRLRDLEFRLRAEPLTPGARTGVGHTRWATHGGVSEENAHPHCDCTGRVTLVHNGIIENAGELAALLVARGHRLTSDVDSEVVAHLVEDELALGWDLQAAVRITTGRLRGSWALAVLAAGHDALVLTSRRSPLVVGTGPRCVVAASDVVALVGVCEEVRFLHDDDLVEVAQTVDWYDGSGRPVERTAVRPHWEAERTSTAGHPDRTAREVAEQADAAAVLLEDWRPDVAAGTVWDRLGLPVPSAVRFLACGTSRHAAEVAARMLRRLGRIHCEVTTASEHDPDDRVPGETTIALSRSGETTDVLRALEDVDGPLLAVTNSASSTLARRADAVFDLGVGPAPGAAATRTFTAQVLAGVFLALSAAGGTLPARALGTLVAELDAVPEALRHAGEIATVRAADRAGHLRDRPGFLFVARGAALPYAAEGALELEELTHRWARCCPCGELRHGPLALVERGTPVVVVEDGAAAVDTVVHEVSARGAEVLRVGFGAGCAFPVLPQPQPHAWGPLESVVALQHLARGIATALGRDVDRPRDLAGSVTVA
ncbi:glutamine--fructose-6-phosphate transaminase (isomerizing) [Kineococcus sp. SYSU DK003]|uniref:glutamine--fructose-6-phosphate transaminase (isomerizing) n=1 Tax=Kineococcus sp. SYSU DK003 TaxID=3383124 RepID=UPI003D7DE7CD